MSDPITVNYPRDTGGYEFSSTELGILESLRDQQQLIFLETPFAIGLGVPIYSKIFEFISDNTAGGNIDAYERKAGVDVKVWTWIKGAISVNAGDGFQADFIREYTKIQYRLREGEVEDAEQRNQEASNRIAFAVVGDILSVDAGNGFLPGISTLGAQDAGQAASEYCFQRRCSSRRRFYSMGRGLIVPFHWTARLFQRLGAH